MSTPAALENSAPVITADRPYSFLGVPIQMLASAESTSGAYGLLDSWSMPTGFASPYHLHHREDEAFYVIEGELAFVLDGKWVRGGPGAYVYGPRGIAHGFKVVSETPARMLLLCVPGGFERFTVDLAQPLDSPPSPPDMAKLVATAARYEIDILGPLPEEPAGASTRITASPSAAGLKALNHLWIKAFNERDWQTERDLRADDFQAILSGSPAPLDNTAWSSFMATFTTAFPDSKITILSCIAEGDRIVTHWSLTGTHRATFQGIPPTGRTIQFQGIEFNRVANGKFTEHISQFDLVGLLGQLGAMPA